MQKYFISFFIMSFALSLSAAESSSNEIQGRISVAATCGVGNSAGKNMCYKGVKSIIAAGLGKSESCVRGILSGGRAIDAMKDLQKAGFTNDRSKCNQKGTILVYRGAASGMSERQAAKYIRSHFHANMTAGDIAGHIEVVGSDGGYYSFLKAFRPITKNPRLGNRRTLVGCYVMDPKNYSSSRIAKCKNSGSHRCNIKAKNSKKKGSYQ